MERDLCLDLERPRLRPGLAAAHDQMTLGYVFVWDELATQQPYPAAESTRICLDAMFDGQRTLRDIQAEAMRFVGGRVLDSGAFTNLIVGSMKPFFWRAHVSGNA